MRMTMSCWLSLAVLALATSPLAIAQGARDEKLYEALSHAKQGSEVDRAAREWVRAGRAMNNEITSRLNAVSKSLDKPELSYDAVIQRHGPLKETKVLHEYTENGLVRLLQVSNDSVRTDVVDRLRWVDKLEASIRDKTKPEVKPNAQELLDASHKYVSLLLDLDAKTRAALNHSTGALECAVTARTVDPNPVDPTKREQPNFEVVYVLEFWSDESARYKTFDKLSTPTTQKLTAGYYMIWCRQKRTDGSFSEGDKKRVEVTEAKDIDLIVPKLKQG